MRCSVEPLVAKRALQALTLVCLATLSFCQYGYNDDLNYYDDYQLYTAGYHYDMYDESDDGFYYNQYTGDYDDVYGDYFFEDAEETEVDCRIGADSSPVFNGTKPCDLKIEGADKLLRNLSGGLDGVYAVWSCENGRPLYKRQQSPPGQDRVLWYSVQYRDWDVTNGSVAQEDDILMFGGSGGRESRPQYVQNEWSIATEFLKDFTGVEEYNRIDLTVVCADGTQTELPALQKFGKTPLLMDDEMEAQYKMVYNRAMARNDASAEINLGLVTLFVMIGLGIVFGLPYLVARNRRMRKERGSASAPSALSNILELTRKRGHVN
ncbi:hypothetical protein COCSUDRAFT_65999 [Coccomyxa subellipsoidea C-169]|uniref:Uncharacterized protein n=1 Tax=Coccomyxa subellipsoidea (strain C-169) TaxID=574566 RepID=I0YYW6_COCSC|nr:hypothetical protein COCSUDRAFT_65999 [Coccomyxa subellipsoidea C-169]EIE23585.1 hypothetical protein COCSUDRAFT_65999 [Coccomyxa subellipsoidea C-169]|eukprot:XP_005648129.1 hypothetical protein COCSUDRAFT_65999 [Coccomyxa subellipsoidea C-169]